MAEFYFKCSTVIYTDSGETIYLSFDCEKGTFSEGFPWSPSLGAIDIKTYKDLMLRVQCDYIMANSEVNFYIDGEGNEIDFYKNDLGETFRKNNLDFNVSSYQSFNENPFWSKLGLRKEEKISRITRKAGYTINGYGVECEAYEIECNSLRKTNLDNGNADLLKIIDWIYDYSWESENTNDAYQPFELEDYYGNLELSSSDIYTNSKLLTFKELMRKLMRFFDCFPNFDFSAFIIELNKNLPSEYLISLCFGYIFKNDRIKENYVDAHILVSTNKGVFTASIFEQDNYRLIYFGSTIEEKSSYDNLIKAIVKYKIAECSRLKTFENLIFTNWDGDFSYRLDENTFTDLKPLLLPVDIAFFELALSIQNGTFSSVKNYHEFNNQLFWKLQGFDNNSSDLVVFSVQESIHMIHKYSRALIFNKINARTLKCFGPIKFGEDLEYLLSEIKELLSEYDIEVDELYEILNNQEFANIIDDMLGFADKCRNQINEEIYKQLLSKIADAEYYVETSGVNSLLEYQKNLVLEISQGNNQKVLDKLKKGYDWTFSIDRNVNLLQLSIIFGCEEVAKFLIKNRIDINQETTEHLTGIRVFDTKIEKGLRAIDIARIRNYHEIVKMIETKIALGNSKIDSKPIFNEVKMDDTQRQLIESLFDSKENAQKSNNLSGLENAYGKDSLIGGVLKSVLDVIKSTVLPSAEFSNSFRVDKSFNKVNIINLLNSGLDVNFKTSYRNYFIFNVDDQETFDIFVYFGANPDIESYDQSKLDFLTFSSFCMNKYWKIIKDEILNPTDHYKTPITKIEDYAIFDLLIEKNVDINSIQNVYYIQDQNYVYHYIKDFLLYGDNLEKAEAVISKVKIDFSKSVPYKIYVAKMEIEIPLWFIYVHNLLYIGLTSDYKRIFKNLGNLLGELDYSAVSKNGENLFFCILNSQDKVSPIRAVKQLLSMGIDPRRKNMDGISYYDFITKNEYEYGKIIDIINQWK